MAFYYAYYLVPKKLPQPRLSYFVYVPEEEDGVDEYASAAEAEAIYREHLTKNLGMDLATLIVRAVRHGMPAEQESVLRRNPSDGKIQVIASFTPDTTKVLNVEQNRYL